MIIQYTVEANDFLMHQLFVASKSVRIKKKRLRSRIALPLVNLGFVLLLYRDGKFVASFIFTCIAVAWYIFYPLWEKGRYVKHYQEFIEENYKDRTGRMSIIELGNEYIFIKDDHSEGRILTNEILEINDIPSVILIRFKGGQSIIMPKDRIQETDDLILFLKNLALRLGIVYNEEKQWKWQ